MPEYDFEPPPEDQAGEPVTLDQIEAISVDFLRQRGYTVESPLATWARTTDEHKP